MRKTSRNLLSLLFFCLLGGAIVLTVALLSPSKPLPVDAQATEFSAGQAMQNLSIQPEPGTMQGPGEFYQGMPTDFSTISRAYTRSGSAP